MNAYQLTDAASASFFALLGIWAAVDRRHWFLRFAAVAGFLLATLLFGAYELVFLFGLEMALIAAGVWLAHGRRTWRPRLSLETALLVMVVAAVAAAVVAKSPDFGLAHWVGIVGSGLGAAYAGLLCLWLVCGKARRWVRLATLPVAIVFFVVMFHFGEALQYALGGGQTWQAAMAAYYEPGYIPTWLAWNLPTIGLVLTILLSALTLARASGWFALEPSTNKAPPARRALAARFTLITLFLALGAPLLYICYRLLTPPPLPAIALPVPNGYDDFVAAGHMAPENVVECLYPKSWSLMTAAQRKQIYDQLQPVVERIDVGLSKECHVPNPYADSTSPAYEREMSAINNAWGAMYVRIEFLNSHGQLEEYMEECLRELRFSEECQRGAGSKASDPYLTGSVARLKHILGNLDAETCRSLAAALDEFDKSRVEFADKIAVQRIIDHRSDWDTHLRLLLSEWSGDDPYEIDSGEDYFRLHAIAELCLLTASAALQAFVLEHGHPPDAIAELAPSYLSAIQLDPLGTGPLKYIRSGATYKVYSHGCDHDDDGGVDENLRNPVGGDMVVAGPPSPTLKKRLRNFGAKAYQDYLKPFLPQSGS